MPAHGNRARRVSRWPVVVVLLLGLVAACTNPNKGDSVLVLGDSITRYDKDDLETKFGREYDLVVLGEEGRTTATVLPEAEFVAGRPFDQVVVNVGSNDVLNGADVNGSIATLRQIVALFPSAECIHLVNVNEHMANLITMTFMTAAARDFNAALANFASSDPRISIIDWKTPTDNSLNDFDPPWSTLTKDSIHPTEEGNRKLNDLYAKALRGC